MSNDKNSNDVFSAKSVISMAFLVVVIGVLIWISFNVNVPSPEALRAMVQGYGWAGWLIFIGITALIAVTPMNMELLSAEYNHENPEISSLSSILNTLLPTYI